MAADELQMLSIHDIRRKLNVSRNTAYARTREEDFPLPFVFGGSYRWPADEFEKWKDAQRATSRDIAPESRTCRPAKRAPKKAVIKDLPLPAPTPVAKRTLVEVSA